MFKGYRTTPCGSEFVGFARTRDDVQYGNPDLQFHMLVNLPYREDVQRLLSLDPKVRLRLNQISLVLYIYSNI